MAITVLMMWEDGAADKINEDSIYEETRWQI
jgi:hypothetical protein